MRIWGFEMFTQWVLKCTITSRVCENNGQCSDCLVSSYVLGLDDTKFNKIYDEIRRNCNNCQYRGDYPGLTPCWGCVDCDKWKSDGVLKLDLNKS